MRLTQLIKSLENYKLIANAGDFEIRGLSCNSKITGPDYVFIAIQGIKEDGNSFVEEAVAKGARAVIVNSSPFDIVVENKVSSSTGKKVTFVAVEDTRKVLPKLAALFFDRPSAAMKVVGITGTNGKTTITYLIEAILKALKYNPGVIGTINYRFKDQLIPSKNTTPGPLELQHMLSQMRNAGVNYAVMEVSSHGLDQNRTDEIRFSSAIFTNLTQDHLDYHKSLEKYFRAKAKLFSGLSSQSFAVINQDDEYSQRLKELTLARVITYAVKNPADVTAKQIKMDLVQTQFFLCFDNTDLKIKTRLIGEHNVYNLLAAFAWAKQEGLDLEAAKTALENFAAVPGRLERVEHDAGFAIFIDYAHTEDALKNVLTSLRKICQNRIIVVFGCGGERDRDKRPKMGRVVSELADYCIITNDNPRSEEPETIIQEIKKGIFGKNYCVITDRCAAIKKAVSLARDGDVVLIAGKGHENYQIFKDKILHFDDMEAVKECLQSKS